MTDIARRAVQLLKTTKPVDEQTGRQVVLRAGMSKDQLHQVEDRYGFRFNPDHAAFLRRVVPDWFDWFGDEKDIRERLAWPVEGLLWHVEVGCYWHEPWGPRPSDPAEAVATAKDHLSQAPVLVPIYCHRYLPAAPAPSGSPVFSVWQSDTIYYGRNLVDYLRNEWLGSRSSDGYSDEKITRVPFWSDLVDENSIAEGPRPIIFPSWVSGVFED